ncbi:MULTISPECIES: histidine kinase [unclassified Microbacterium]|uniref:histidine kinase n=1 Tax=unclassified Microbacterium TaxID=2609290 RepID=UPI00214D0EE2|nr:MULTISPECIES: histidine kinase [unclassified Microbacterium]MCR2810200.1 histidine kinase [Microbacterium sp. zg.B185]WIM19968.1 histidine kinase [Microbacterium sp. zg-B185]
MRTHTVDRLAAVVLGLEGLAVAALVGWQIWALAAGDTGAVETAIALLVLTAVGAAAVLAFAVATWRGQSWGRSGGVVTQLLILAVALGAVTGAYSSPATGLALAVPGLVALVLLVLAVRAAGRRAGGAAPE